MEWWNLKDFENTDNKVRVGRNLYIIYINIYLYIIYCKQDKIEVELVSARGTTKI